MSRLDLRGFGWSDAPRGGYDKEELATDVLAVLDALDSTASSSSATTGAGGSGCCSACARPDRFDRFLALGIIHPWQPRAAAPPLGRLLVPAIDARPGSATAFIAQAFVRCHPASGTSRRVRLRQTALATFADPCRARPCPRCVQLYRTFIMRETLPIRAAATTSRASPCGRTCSSAATIRHPDADLTAGYEHHADV